MRNDRLLYFSPLANAKIEWSTEIYGAVHLFVIFISFISFRQTKHAAIKITNKVILFSCYIDMRWQG